jgi:flavin reductase (DIM6/NTAB) family NADH-FMN oxidoreductase RutF
MRSYDPDLLPTPELHQYLTGAVAPRPIALVSSLSAEGVPNLAPYSFFNVFSSHPPMAVFSSNRRVRDRSTKDTLANVEATGEVVINLVNHAMVHQMALTSVEYPPEVSEFAKAGLTPLAAEVVKPFRVAESPVQLECRVAQMIPLGDGGGAGTLIVCRIVRLHLSEHVFDEQGKLDPHRIDLMGRMGRAFYVRASGPAVFPILRNVQQLGIGVDLLPAHIRLSPVLTGNDLAQLAAATAVPAFDEDILADPEVMNARAGNQQDMSRRLHLHAQDLVSKGDIDRAWQVLLSETLA